MKAFLTIILIAVTALGYSLSVSNIPDRTTHEVLIPIVAVSSDNGTIGNATISIVSGKGRVLLDNTPSIDTDMQGQIDTAVGYAKYYTKENLEDKDVIIDLEMHGEIVGGVSSGAAIAVATIAAIQEKNLREDAIITGTISPDGIIRKVGEIREKATVARDNGYKLLLVPPGQSRYRFIDQPFWEYFNNTIEIMEVATVEEAAKIMIR